MLKCLCHTVHEFLVLGGSDSAVSREQEQLPRNACGGHGELCLYVHCCMHIMSALLQLPVASNSRQSCTHVVASVSCMFYCLRIQLHVGHNYVC